MIKWKELIDTIELDVWGKPYQLVVKRTKLAVSVQSDKEVNQKIIAKLFPSNPKFVWRKRGNDNFDDITEKEISKISEKN